jgi:uncharacterized membrane protein YraQ (UPF0718 family)
MENPKKRDPIPFVLALIVLVLAIIAWRQGGAEFAAEGAITGGKLLWHEILLLAAAFLTAGLIQTLVSKEMVERWLGSESGWKGLLLACLGGALIPGGPYVYYPIAGALLQSGAGLGVLISFVTAKNLWSISRLPIEFALLGSELTISRFVVTLLIPPILGLLSEMLFGRAIARIRQAIQR